MDGTYEGSPAERSGRVGDEAAEQLQGGHEDAALWAPGQSLRAAERLLLACAQTGTDFGFGGTPGLDTAVGWEPERTLRAAVLRHLLTRPEWPVTGDGVRIRGARIIGALDLQGEVMRCALFLDGCYLDGPGPLMLQHTTGSEISLRDCRQGAGGGVLAQWLKTSGNLDLSGSVLSGPVDLTGADIGGYLVCSAAQLPAGQDGCSLLGQHMKVGADVHLNAGFTADGSVMLDGAQIAGALIASGARLAGDRDGTALSGNWIKVSGGGMKLDRLVTANSAVSLIDADITGDLVLSGACLAANPEGRSLVGPRVTVSGNVALDEGFAASGALYLTHAHIGGALFCMGAQLGGADRDGWALQAFGAIASEVMLTRVRADGAVSLDDAQIAKDLSCDDMRITCANAHGIAFSCAGITVAGLLSQEGLAANGAVWLLGAEITGGVVFVGARITSAGEHRVALNCQGMKVKVGSLTLERARLRGGVWLSDADIAGNLEYENVQLTADDKGCALFAYRLNVAGNLTFRELQAEGTVLLSGAQIGGSLICNGGRVIAAFTDGSALRGDKMKVGEDVYIDDGFTARGTVNLAGTEICGDLDCGRVQLAVLSGQKALDAAGLRVEGELRWRTASAVAGIVDLEHARAGRVNDVTGHWPEDGRLRLQGFTYLGFSDMRHPDICERLEWVRGSGLGFAPQPYRQLAQVYRQAGMEKEARQVAIAQRNDQRRDPDLLPLPSRIGSWLLDKTIKHGYQPLRAVGFLAVLYLAMLLMFWAAQHHDGIIVPSGTTRATATVCNPRYPCFYPAGYAFDTVVPIISLGQASSWRIDAAAPWGWAYTTASWTATGLGWVFATLAAAGFTGLIRKE